MTTLENRVDDLRINHSLPTALIAAKSKLNAARSAAREAGYAARAAVTAFHAGDISRAELDAAEGRAAETSERARLAADDYADTAKAVSPEFLKKHAGIAAEVKDLAETLVRLLDDTVNAASSLYVHAVESGLPIQAHVADVANMRRLVGGLCKSA